MKKKTILARTEYIQPNLQYYNSLNYQYEQRDWHHEGVEHSSRHGDPAERASLITSSVEHHAQLQNKPTLQYSVTVRKRRQMSTTFLAPRRPSRNPLKDGKDVQHFSH